MISEQRLGEGEGIGYSRERAGVEGTASAKAPKQKVADGHGGAVRPGWLWRVRARVAGNEVRKVWDGDRIILGLIGHCNDLSFYSK